MSEAAYGEDWHMLIGPVPEPVPAGFGLVPPPVPPPEEPPPPAAPPALGDLYNLLHLIHGSGDTLSYLGLVDVYKRQLLIHPSGSS